MKTNKSNSRFMVAGINPRAIETLQSYVVLDSAVLGYGKTRPNRFVIKRPVMIPWLTAIPYLLSSCGGMVSARYMFVAHRFRIPAKPSIKRPMQLA